MEKASKAYYDGEPIISNEEFDALEAIHGQSINGSGDIEHMYRMYSLKKHYDVDGDLPLNKRDCVETPKLDGAAVSILYIDGNFQHALTRGNGIMGRDISTKILTLGVPLTIPCTKPTQVTGELVASKHMENSRNYASGALGQKDLSVWEQRKTDGLMKFVAYNVQIAQNRWGWSNNYTFDMEELFNIGFSTILDKDANWSDTYPTDGIVFRLGNSIAFNKAGFTDKFPRGAIAWKDKQESVQTTILGVEWQTGKSGKVTPVALLDPVVIGEATISRATLNNIAYIEALDLELGCTVEVIRSGEIIPKIIGRVY
jgi:DNA ligase (NAD+)|tara:strand:- start:429 stop:1370 length:942 start_codon:yes stop_codon:yes gene_type:complete